MLFRSLALGLALLLPVSGRAESCVSQLEAIRKAQGLPFRAIAELLPHARYLDAKKQFWVERQKRLKRLTDKRHAPILLDHGKPTDYVVVLTHGLYDSPHTQRHLARLFFQKGMNVIAPLLPRHWEKDAKSLDRLRFEELRKAEAHAIALAKKMGKKVILVGHSAGGLLATDAALRDPSIAGLVLMAPALELSAGMSIVTRVASVFGATANPVLGRDPDPLFTPYYSSHAGNELRRLGDDMRERAGYETIMDFDPSFRRAFKREMYRKIKAPTMVLSSAGENYVDNDEMDLMLSSVSAPVRQVRVESLNHSTVGQFPAEAGGRGPASAGTEVYRDLWRRTEAFVDRYIVGAAPKKRPPKRPVKAKKIVKPAPLPPPRPVLMPAQRPGGAATDTPAALTE